MDNKLVIHQVIFSTISKVVIKVKEIEKYTELRLKASISNYVAGLVHAIISESTLSTKDKKNIDQVKIIIQVLNEVYDLTDAEVNIVQDHLDHDHDHKLIKKQSNLKKGLSFAGSLLTFLSKR